ncbi:FecR domain-containing protein [Chitinophaga pendula]|uniref:FecR family protein n=1 Tax=Chitinophaga TaxID=79328 RepID=UPI000BB072B0|nr:MULTISPECIES: FecR domain-containing protein [Chitinophaga]ASZ11608.1 hypothetical protein CK934_11875 [Chitinophaga sp. MD30]UCJ05382.1 FecR domain-containing protein [Chitinophaga pendula]
MHPDLDHIENLILEDIAGTISPADKSLLDQLLAENTTAARLKDDIYQTLTPEILASLSARTGKVLTVIQTRKQRKRILLSAAAALLLLIITAGGYYLWQPVNKATDSHQILLTMADGRKVDLSAHQGTLKQNGTTFLNHQQTLTLPATSSASSEWVTLSIPPGKDYHVQLSDGTEIWLNASSTLKFPLSFSGEARRVTISGEAYLQVAAQSEHPFIVALPQGEVQVLGTAFNVNTYEQQAIRVSLVSGAVKMKVAQDSVLLQPGYQSIYKTGSQLTTQQFDTEEVLSWRKGIYTFYGATLEEVSHIIPRWYGIQIVIDDPAAGQKQFFGIIDRHKPIETFLEDLRATDGISYYFDQQKILHLR